MREGVPGTGASGVQPVAHRPPMAGAGGAASRLRPTLVGPGSWGQSPVLPVPVTALATRSTRGVKLRVPWLMRSVS